MNKCIFCEQELSLMQRKKLACGNTMQILCSNCYEQYKSIPFIERAEAALRTGRAENEGNLKEYLKQIRSVHAEAEEKQRLKDEQRLSELECLRCHQKMVDHGLLTFKLGEERYFFSDIYRLFSGSLTMNVFRCPSCGKAEFFIPDPQILDEFSEEKDV